MISFLFGYTDNYNNMLNTGCNMFQDSPTIKKKMKMDLYQGNISRISRSQLSLFQFLHRLSNALLFLSPLFLKAKHSNCIQMFDSKQALADSTLALKPHVKTWSAAQITSIEPLILPNPRNVNKCPLISLPLLLLLSPSLSCPI